MMYNKPFWVSLVFSRFSFPNIQQPTVISVCVIQQKKYLLLHHTQYRYNTNHVVTLALMVAAALAETLTLYITHTRVLLYICDFTCVSNTDTIILHYYSMMGNENKNVFDELYNIMVTSIRRHCSYVFIHNTLIQI